MISENGKHRIGITGEYKENMDLVCDLAAAFIDGNHPSNKALKNG